jgi:TetR/AcrR family transcriptional regulator, copper-responsive repressor
MGRPRKFSREGVLQKALPLFWTYGFAQTTLPELERATAVNKSGLYAEFENKEALFLACLEHYLETRDGAATLTTAPLGWSNIQKFLEEAPARAEGQRGCFSVNSMRELSGLPPEAEKIISRGRAKLRRLLKANVTAANPSADSNALCDMISIFFSGVCIEANLNQGSPRAQKRKVEAFMQMLRAN